MFDIGMLDHCSYTGKIIIFQKIEIFKDKWLQQHRHNDEMF